MDAIPTTYKGITFRSRNEARWAAFFDLLKWQWEYEPFDLKGYIPDFVIRFKHYPLLIEVKHETDFKALESHDALDKIARSGWDKEALIVGAALFEERYTSDKRACLGVLAQFMAGESVVTSGGDLIFCSHCNTNSVNSDIQSFHCRNCGFNDGGNHASAVSNARTLWGEAQSIVQWKPK